jgi:hypothetical protein
MHYEVSYMRTRRLIENLNKSALSSEILRLPNDASQALDKAFKLDHNYGVKQSYYIKKHTNYHEEINPTHNCPDTLVGVYIPDAAVGDKFYIKLNFTTYISEVIISNPNHIYLPFNNNEFLSLLEAYCSHLYIGVENKKYNIYLLYRISIQLDINGWKRVKLYPLVDTKYAIYYQSGTVGIQTIEYFAEDKSEYLLIDNILQYRNERLVHAVRILCRWCVELCWRPGGLLTHIPKEHFDLHI